jgi:hypothetical protein
LGLHLIEVCVVNCLLSWIESHPGTASWVQAAGAICAILIAIAVPWWQQRRARAADQREKADELASVRLALHTEVGIVGRECLHLGCLLHDDGGDPAQKNLRSLRMPPLTIFRANAGKVGQLTRDEIVHLIGFSATLFDMSVVANDLMGREMKGPRIREDVDMLQGMWSRACRHAAEFLAAVPDIPDAEKDQAFIAALRRVGLKTHDQG